MGKSADFGGFQKLDTPLRGGPRGGEIFLPIFRVLWLTKTLEKLVELFSRPDFDFFATAEKNLRDRARF